MIDAVPDGNYLTADELAESLEHEQLDQIVKDHFFEKLPWYFRNDAEAFNYFRNHFSEGLDIDPAGICLVGSAQTGFAVGPDTFPKAFHDQSDLDVVVVSEDLFDRIWLNLVIWAHPRRHKFPKREWRWVRSRQEDIFWGWIRPDAINFKNLKFPEDLQPARQVRVDWFNTFKTVGEIDPQSDLARRQVNGRLYRSWKHVEGYQVESLRRLRYRLQAANQGE